MHRINPIANHATDDGSMIWFQFREPFRTMRVRKLCGSFRRTVPIVHQPTGNAWAGKVVAAICRDEQAPACHLAHGRQEEVFMSTHLSQHFEQARLSLGLKPSQVALQCGCSNHLKVGSRIRQFELTGTVSKHLFQRLTAFYRIDPQVLKELQERDRQEAIEKWNRWADVPIQPYLVIRWMPAVYSRRILPPEIQSLDDALVWAASIARETRRRCSLAWSRRLTIYFEEDGSHAPPRETQPGTDPVPYMQIGNKRFLLGG